MKSVSVGPSAVDLEALNIYYWKNLHVSEPVQFKPVYTVKFNCKKKNERQQWSN